ncbi:hypothetical protein [Cerasicoccus fimbriatus]|uniref:hypothetical protein n=1 Tax=Cerasicoccus fimbriatus TaxID=3014554 RepID=UPI0022B54C0D|nr:hypothetical protein [Cerasicoccus sp. TK19100]
MADTLGHETLSQRLAQIPEYLDQTLGLELPSLEPLAASRGVVATGMGSSEAAARYLVRLLNLWTPVRAEFLPLNQFYSMPAQRRDARHLVVFTQGLAPNAQIALAQRRQFSGLTLVTSSTEQGQSQAGKGDRAELLQTLAKQGATIVRHPLENEFEILPRVIGPVCAMATALIIAANIGNKKLPKPEILTAIQADFRAQQSIHTLADELLAGVDFYFANPTQLYAQNLSAKVLETIFRPAPRVRDLFDYSHGPFQAEIVTPAHRWLFTSAEAAEQALVNDTSDLFNRINTAHVITSPLPEPFAIFYYESVLNQIVAEAARRSGANLIDWPGKGLDGEGYALNQPFTLKDATE